MNKLEFSFDNEFEFEVIYKSLRSNYENILFVYNEKIEIKEPNKKLIENLEYQLGILEEKLYQLEQQYTIESLINEVFFNENLN